MKKFLRFLLVPFVLALIVVYIIFFLNTMFYEKEMKKEQKYIYEELNKIYDDEELLKSCVRISHLGDSSFKSISTEDIYIISKYPEIKNLSRYYTFIHPLEWAIQTKVEMEVEKQQKEQEFQKALEEHNKAMP